MLLIFNFISQYLYLVSDDFLESFEYWQWNGYEIYLLSWMLFSLIFKLILKQIARRIDVIRMNEEISMANVNHNKCDTILISFELFVELYISVIYLLVCLPIHCVC